MTVSWMSELATTNVASSDTVPRNGFVQPEVWRHGTTRNDDGRASLRKLRVLVVDDVPDATDGLVRLVRRWGHTACFAYGCLAALRVAADQHPDVVLLGLDRPMMDGCHVAQRLRLDSTRPASFIIAIADSADDERRQHCIQSGIDLLLIRPVDPSILETLLVLECMRANRMRTRTRTPSPLAERTIASPTNLKELQS